MYGRVRCAHYGCGAARERTDWTCPRCGEVKAYVDIKHKGVRYRLKDERGELFTNIERAHDYLSSIRLAYNENKDSFNPHDFTRAGIQDRKFKYQADKWLAQKKEECESGELSWETYKDYNGYLINHFTPLDGLDVRKIDYQALENFRDGLPKALKLKTRRNIMNAVHAIFRWMHRKGVIKEVPAFPEIEGDDATMRRAITWEQQQAGLAMIPAPDRDPIEFGFEMGLRPGETCALKIGDIDQIGQRILIQRTWSGSHLKETTKGKRKIWMRLTSRAWEIVFPLLKDRSLDEFVFINPRTRCAYRQKVLNRLWKEHTKSDLVHYEASRHSFCTQIVNDGHSTAKAQVLMRHADVKSTLKYFHADSDDLLNAMENRGRLNTFQTRIKKRK